MAKFWAKKNNYFFASPQRYFCKICHCRILIMNFVQTTRFEIVLNNKYARYSSFPGIYLNEKCLYQLVMFKFRHYFCKVKKNSKLK